HVAKSPAGIATRGLAGVTGQVIGLARQVREAQVLVLLPVPVGGEFGQAAEAGFALAQRLGGKLAIGDVADDAVEEDATIPDSRRVHAVAHPAHDAVWPHD